MAPDSREGRHRLTDWPTVQYIVGLSAVEARPEVLDTFYRNGIYEALRQSSPEVEDGKPIILDGQHLLDMAGAVFAYLDSIGMRVPPFEARPEEGETLNGNVAAVIDAAEEAHAHPAPGESFREALTRILGSTGHAYNVQSACEVIREADKLEARGYSAGVRACVERFTGSLEKIATGLEFLVARQPDYAARKEVVELAELARALTHVAIPNENDVEKARAAVESSLSEGEGQ